MGFAGRQHRSADAITALRGYDELMESLQSLKVMAPEQAFPAIRIIPDSSGAAKRRSNDCIVRHASPRAQRRARARRYGPG